MKKRYSVYLGEEDEELAQFIEDAAEDVFGSESEFFKKAAKVMKQEKGDVIESLMTDDSDNTVI